MKINLTPKEVEIISLLANGLTCKEIARFFGETHRNFEFYIQKIRKKLHARNTTQAVVIAVKNKLLVYKLF